jgi:hypothetical protein
MEDGGAEKISRKDGLTLGTQHLTIAPLSPGMDALWHDGLAAAQAPSYLTPEFTVLQRWNGPETSAALVEGGVAASQSCSTVYVLEERAREGFKTHELGELCVGYEIKSLVRTREGFALIEPATPVQEGMSTEWDEQTGELTRRKLLFQPTPGTKMIDFIKNYEGSTSEPLRNAEFFNAISSVQDPDRKRFLIALWQVTNSCPGCDNSEIANSYGRYDDKSILAYSGCGQYMNGGIVRCQADDALAIWVRNGGSFFFAIKPHRGEDQSRKSDVHFYPPRNRWPTVTIKKLTDWLNGPVQNWTVQAN